MRDVNYILYRAVSPHIFIRIKLLRFHHSFVSNKQGRQCKFRRRNGAVKGLKCQRGRVKPYIQYLNLSDTLNY